MFQLILALISMVASVAGAVLLPLLRQYLIHLIGAARTSLLISLAKIAVSTAEQQLKGAPNTAKKGVAVSVFKGLADSRNLKVDDASIHAFLEAAVFVELPHLIQASFISTPDQTVAPASTDQATTSPAQAAA